MGEKVKIPGKAVVRDSNIELYRILVMLLIVAHHYVVNSGLVPLMCEVPGDISSIYLFLLGAWGKIGINCFVLITGYFMCKSQITLKKFLKLLLEVEFYKIAIALIFWVTGYEPYTMKSFIKVILPIEGVNDGFTSCYLLFYLLIPFINILIQNMNEKLHLALVSICLFIYTILGTLRFMSVEMNYVSWFFVLYLIASYVRCYPKKIFDNAWVWGAASVVSVVLSIVSVLWPIRSGTPVAITEVYYYVLDSNKILAVVTGFCTFMLFKNIKIKKSRIINTLAASTFGVLQIHANSEAMRRFLWVDLLENIAYFGSRILIIHSMVCVVGIFLICCAIDQLRIRFLEKPFFHMLDKYIENGTMKK